MHFAEHWLENSLRIFVGVYTYCNICTLYNVPIVHSLKTEESNKPLITVAHLGGESCLLFLIIFHFKVTKDQCMLWSLLTHEELLDQDNNMRNCKMLLVSKAQKWWLGMPALTLVLQILWNYNLPTDYRYYRD